MQHITWNQFTYWLILISMHTQLHATDLADFELTECCDHTLLPQANVVGEEFAHFGTNVSINGPVALVSATGLGEQGQLFEAIFDDTTHRWTLSDAIEQSEPRRQFGLNVKLTDTFALIYGRGNSLENPLQGHLDVFMKSAEGWFMVDSLEDANWSPSHELFTAHGSHLFKVNADRQSFTIYALAETGLEPIWHSPNMAPIQDLTLDPATQKLAVLTASGVHFYQPLNGIWTSVEVLMIDNTISEHVALSGDQLVVVSDTEELLPFTWTTTNGWQPEPTIELLDTIDVHGLKLSDNRMMFNAYRGRYTDLVVMTRQDQQWVSTQLISPNDNNPPDLQGAGFAFDLADDRLLLGQWAFQLATGRLMGYAWTGEQWQHQQTINQPGATSSATHKQFGISMAQDGEHLAVMTAGEAEQADDVYLYQLVDDGWRLKQVLNVPGFNANGDWPHGMDLRDDRLLIGVPEATSAWNTQGLVHFYEYDGQSWLHRSEIPSPNLDPDTDSVYGFEITLSGDRMAVASATITDDEKSPPQLAPGRVMTYVFDPDHYHRWHFVHSIGAPNGFNNDHFGHALSMDDNWMVVGSPATNDSTTAQLDAAYVFEVNTDMNAYGQWLFKQKLFPDPMTSDSRYGQAVKLHQNQIIVSNPSQHANGYVKSYELSQDLWYLQATLSIDFDQPSNRLFGSQLDLNDRYLVVASPTLENDPEQLDEVFVFGQIDGQWLPHQRISLPANNEAMSAVNVALSDQQLLVGDPSANQLGTLSGSVFKQNLPEPVSPETEESPHWLGLLCLLFNQCWPDH